jgi:hypothetical protein
MSAAAKYQLSGLQFPICRSQAAVLRQLISIWDILDFGYGISDCGFINKDEV